MRIAGTTQDSLIFDSGRTIEPPLLLALPFAIFTSVSFASGAFSPLRVSGALALLAAAASCLFFGLGRTRIELRPSRQSLVMNGRTIALAEDVQLVLERTGASHPEASLSPFEVAIVDGVGLREVLLRSTLANVLNDLRVVRRQWPAAVISRVESDQSLESLVTDEGGHNSCLQASELQLASPALNFQFQIAGILAAVACLAAIVVSVLVTGQLQAQGALTGLGLALGATLAAVPAMIAVHIARGRVQLKLDSEWVQIQTRSGLWGTSVTSIPRRELTGSWLVRIDGPDCCELLLLHRGVFSSVPIARSVFETWKSGLNPSPACAA